MKRIVLGILTIMLMLSFNGCGDKESNDDGTISGDSKNKSATYANLKVSSDLSELSESDIISVALEASISLSHFDFCSL